MLLLNILIFVVALFILGWASELTLRGNLRLFTLFRADGFAGALFLIGFAVALPEIFVALFSAFFNIQALSFGNIIGANIADLTLVLGLSAFFSSGIYIDNLISKKNFWVTVLLALLPIIVSLDGIINRFDAILLLLIFCLYAWVVALDFKFIIKIIGAIPFSVFHLKDAVKSFKESVAGHLLLVFSAISLVVTSVNLSEYFSINPIYFGLIFLGLATTLPEILFNAEANILRRPSLVLGIVLGSVAVNSTAVLGLLALVSPVKVSVDPISLFLHGLFIFMAFLLFKTFAYTGRKISREEGIILVLLYILFFISQLYFL